MLTWDEDVKPASLQPFAASAVERGRLLMALSRKVNEHTAELTALEQRDCGKQIGRAHV
jgi:acyl-CoA reductase-like NAD-dependent aldehyde dehydrogenase